MQPLLSIRDLRKRFGPIEVLKGITLDVQPKQVVGFIGASGSGKSTLLRCINMLEVPEAGTIRLSGEQVGFREGEGRRPLPPRELSRQRRRMAMVFQSFNLFAHKTILENVTLGPIKVRKQSRADAEKRARELLDRVGVSAQADKYPAQLSGGQQQRVAIARALALQPEVILFDEPTSALDPELVGEVLKVIRDLAEEGMTMVIVTHEMGFAHEVCDHIVFLADGQVEDQGPPAHIFGVTAKPRTRDFTRRYMERHGIGAGMSPAASHA